LTSSGRSFRISVRITSVSHFAVSFGIVGEHATTTNGRESASTCLLAAAACSEAERA
jgi:hypothetical protein